MDKQDGERIPINSLDSIMDKKIVLTMVDSCGYGRNSSLSFLFVQPPRDAIHRWQDASGNTPSFGDPTNNGDGRKNWIVELLLCSRFCLPNIDSFVFAFFLRFSWLFGSPKDGADAVGNQTSLSRSLFLDRGQHQKLACWPPIGRGLTQHDSFRICCYRFPTNHFAPERAHLCYYLIMYSWQFRLLAVVFVSSQGERVLSAYWCPLESFLVRIDHGFVLQVNAVYVLSSKIYAALTLSRNPWTLRKQLSGVSCGNC